MRTSYVDAIFQSLLRKDYVLIQASYHHKEMENHAHELEKDSYAEVLALSVFQEINVSIFFILSLHHLVRLNGHDGYADQHPLVGGHKPLF